MKKFFAAVLTMIFMVGLLAMPAEAADTGDITIFVNPGNAVTGATVSVTVNGQTKTATSDYMGRVVFSALPVGTYSFKVSKGGYNDGAASFTVNVGSDNFGSIYMKPQVGFASVRVFDATTNQPVSGAQVTLSGNGTSQYVNTDSSGKAYFNGIQVGSYRCTAIKDGYNEGSGGTITLRSDGMVYSTIKIFAPFSVTLHFSPVPTGMTLVKGELTPASQWFNNLKDLTFMVQNTGTYTFLAKWKDSKGNFKYTQSAISITKAGTYTVNPTAAEWNTDYRPGW